MLAALDPFTLGLAVSITLFTIAILSVFFVLTTKSYIGSAYWAASLVLLSLGFMALTLRGQIPFIVSVVGVNYGIYLSLCLFYDGLARFHGYRDGAHLNPLNHGLALVALGAVLYYTYIDASVNARVVLFNLFQLFISLRLLWLMAQLRPAWHRAPLFLLALVFVTLSCLSLARIYMALNASPMASVIKEDLSLRLVMLINLGLSIILSFSMMLMTHIRIEQEMEEARGKAVLDSRTDRLTGLWNRHHFETEIQREIDRAARYRHPATLLMFDIDHFKHVNDEYGHLAGDEVLKEVARCARDTMRTTDLPCRWGGEEFIVLMPETDEEAVRAAEKLRQYIEAHEFAPVGRITISVGVAQLRVDDDIGGWMRRVDAALYRAKARGRNRVEKEVPDFALTSPMSLRWVPGFTCGDATIDQQHQALFDKTNRLLDRCSAPGQPDVAALMEDLLEDVERHFRFEEDVLKKACYASLAAHAEEHARLADAGKSLLQEFRAGAVPAGALSSFVIRELVLGHIAEDDMHYAACLHAHKAAGANPTNDISPTPT